MLLSALVFLLDLVCRFVLIPFELLLPVLLSLLRGFFLLFNNHRLPLIILQLLLTAIGYHSLFFLLLCTLEGLDLGLALLVDLLELRFLSGGQLLLELLILLSLLPLFLFSFFSQFFLLLSIGHAPLLNLGYLLSFLLGFIDLLLGFVFLHFE